MAKRACEQGLRLATSVIAFACEPYQPLAGDTSIPDEVCCELQRGHPGAHLAQIQAFGSDEAWAEWIPAAVAVRHFADEAMCTASGTDEDGDDDAVCELPAGHHGAHSFALRHRYSHGRDPSADKQLVLRDLLRSEDPDDAGEG